jgi:hypothetical protein
MIQKQREQEIIRSMASRIDRIQDQIDRQRVTIAAAQGREQMM